MKWKMSTARAALTCEVDLPINLWASCPQIALPDRWFSEVCPYSRGCSRPVMGSHSVTLRLDTDVNSMKDSKNDSNSDSKNDSKSNSKSDFRNDLQRSWNKTPQQQL